MYWKKNVFSYLLWLLYVVAVEAGLVCLMSVMCDAAGVSVGVGSAACALYLAMAGAAVLLLHRSGVKRAAACEVRRPVRIVPEAAAAVLLPAVGLALRVCGIAGAVSGSAWQDSVYYQTAAVGSGGEIPWTDHGAAYLYTLALRGLFYFVGNKPEAAIWAQAAAQMGAALLLYFAVRRFAGGIAATVTLGFLMFSGYYTELIFSLSPAMPYLLLWAVVLLLAAATAGKGLWRFLPLGGLIAFVSYLDVSGVLLLFAAAAVIFSGEERPEARGRWKRLALCLAGTGAGFAACVQAAAAMCGKTFGDVLNVWLRLYRPRGSGLSVTAQAGWRLAEYIVLFCVLTLWVFAFWRDRRRDRMKMWILLAAVLAAAGRSGILTAEVPAGPYLYLILAVMAGAAAAECVREMKQAPVEAAAAERAAVAGDKAASEERAAVAGDKAASEERAAVAGDKAASEARAAVAGDKAAPGARAAASVEGSEIPAEETVSEKRTEAPAAAVSEKRPETSGEAKPVRLIENPLPLPKRKPVRRRLEYDVTVPADREYFDLEVDEKDDFDI